MLSKKLILQSNLELMFSRLPVRSCVVGNDKKGRVVMREGELTLVMLERVELSEVFLQV